ncbi:SLOG family protein [Frankia sp. AgW1.1]|uniref:SLOG family protein n=1 Tax=Frankia sp. AgW1.1 TaxID=1836971 RepID=UPI0019342C50|nr:SLOG family protein [Frankia sp. AgW1.1]MBL7487038.1 DUF2493 domain-containing protein [Frankia sp. AgW1.1]
MTDRRILITGSRAWQNGGLIGELLGQQIAYLDAGGTLTVVHGACPRGADAHAAQWVEETAAFYSRPDLTAWRIVAEPHPALWRPAGVFDKAAGFRRNAEMVNLGADLVLAFIRDRSKGATHTAHLAVDAGLVLRVYRETSA